MIQIDYRFLGIALLLLWLPRQWLRFGQLGSRSRGRRQKAWTPKRDREPGEISVRFGEEFTKPRNWIDLLRAGVGSYALCGCVFTLSADANLPVRNSLFWLQASFLFVGFLIQILRSEVKVTLFAPLFYLQGLAIGLLGWSNALLAITAIWAINPVLPSAAIFLFIFGGLGVCFGLVMPVGATFTGRDSRDVYLLLALAVLPGALSLVLRRRLAQFTKKTKIIMNSGSES